MRMMGMMALGGLAGLVIMKMLAALLLPLFGMMFGLVATLLKLGLWIAVGYFIYTLIRNRREKATEV